MVIAIPAATMVIEIDNAILLLLSSGVKSTAEYRIGDRMYKYSDLDSLRLLRTEYQTLADREARPTTGRRSVASVRRLN